MTYRLLICFHLVISGESDYLLQHLQELFRIIREIYKNKKRMEDEENE